MRIPLPLPLALLVLAAAGCASSRSSNGEAFKPVPTILTDMRAAVAGARSVHVVGAGRSGARTIAIDLELVAGRGGEGTITDAGLSVQIVRVGAKAFFRGGRSFWAHYGSGALAARLAGRWIEAPASSSDFSSFAPFMTIPALFDQIIGTHGVLEKGSVTTLDGQRAFTLVDTTEGGTLYVAESGKPYPLEITAKKGESGVIRFEGWNGSYKVTAPGSSIAFSSLTG